MLRSEEIFGPKDHHKVTVFENKIERKSAVTERVRQSVYDGNWIGIMRLCGSHRATRGVKNEYLGCGSTPNA